MQRYSHASVTLVPNLPLLRGFSVLRSVGRIAGSRGARQRTAPWKLMRPASHHTLLATLAASGWGKRYPTSLVVVADVEGEDAVVLENVDPKREVCTPEAPSRRARAAFLVD